MAANPTNVPPAPPPPSDFVNVEVDGVPVKARKGAMIIHVTDAEHAYVPRFCYHEKLPIAANCRMCLVEVEKAPKPLPACATPVAEGMKIFTKSANAIGAQKATMEFLLINHPLDCPICDQGGECELQDLAVGFGRDVSRFHERKRVVKDKNLGPLVSTDMTRCIHCTRCVRFGQDVAGIQELGTTGRGEHMEIGTFVEKSVDHELSGNIIDLCPVGALNSKPFRYQGRSWEMTQHALVSPHDGVGTNLYAHVRRGRLMRVVPRANESINETWIADRDRFSYEAVYSPDRLLKPMVRIGSDWHTVDWERALAAAADGLRRHAREVGTLVSASATTEEAYLAARLTRSLGSGNVDHRLRQIDFRDGDADALQPSLGVRLEDVDSLEALLVVGCHLRAEVPMLAHRVRKAARRGAKIAMLNPAAFEHLFPVAATQVSAPSQMVADLAAVLAAAADDVVLTPEISEAVARANVTPAHRALAAALKNGERRAIWLGALALRHPAWADLRALAMTLARVCNASLGVIAEGGNAAGAWLAGAVPHREAGGRATAATGRHAREMLETALPAYLLVGGVEPWADVAGGAARATLSKAACVVAITPFADEITRELATVILPCGTFAETSGTYVNLAGTWQSFTGAAQPVGESRPAWKVLRVLGNALSLEGFDYQSSESVLAELRERVAGAASRPSQTSHRVIADIPPAEIADFAIYGSDALVRRAPALQATAAGQEGLRLFGRATAQNTTGSES
jgi:NADH-quinone oxidoreductase subunit G